MDLWGFVILAIGAVVYFVVKDKRWGCGLMGFGGGIIVAAIWAVLIVYRTLGK